MKILQVSTPFLPVSPDLKYGGSERVLYLLDKELTSLGLSAGVVAPEGSMPASRLFKTLIQGCGVGDILNRKISSWEGYCSRAEHAALSIQYANQIETDIVHLHDDNILPFDFLIRRPTLVTLHSDIDGFWDLKKNPSLAKRKTKYVAISKSQKAIYESRGHKVDHVIYNSVDEDCYSVASDILPYLLSLGGINPMKGQKDAITVSKRTGLDLIIAGNIGDVDYFETEIKPHITHDLNGEDDKLKAYRTIQSTDQKIVYVGSVNDRQKAPLFSHAKAFLMPIHWDEPFGLVLVESMMSGTPVVAYGRGAIPEVVSHGITGFIVEDLGEMINVIQEIKNKESFNRNSLRTLSIERFGKRNMAKNYIDYYQQLL